MKQRHDLCEAISALTGDRPSVVGRVVDGLVAVILDRTLHQETTTVNGLGRFENHIWKGRAMFIPSGTVGAVRVLSDRIKLTFRTSPTTADRLRDAGIPPTR